MIQDLRPQAKPSYILIVDDEPSIALTFQRALQLLTNHNIIIATDGYQALRLFEQIPFDVITLDNHMPGMDGITLAKEIRKRSSQVRMMMVTTVTEEGLYQYIDNILIQKLLTKPVMIGDFLEAILQLLPQEVY